MMSDWADRQKYPQLRLALSPFLDQIDLDSNKGRDLLIRGLYTPLLIADFHIHSKFLKRKRKDCYKIATVQCCTYSQLNIIFQVKNERQ